MNTPHTQNKTRTAATLAALSAFSRTTPIPRRLAGIALTGVLTGLLAACGGGGGGGGAAAPVAGSVVALSSPRVTQATAGEGVLAYRVAFNNPVYPMTIEFTLDTFQGFGLSCNGTARFYIPAQPNVVMTGFDDTITGRLTINSASDPRTLNLAACPGTDSTDVTVTVSWRGGGGNGTATGTIRGATNPSVANTQLVNDSGTTTCGNATTNNLACPQSGFPGQDGEAGRDTVAAITGSGTTRTSSFALATSLTGGCIQDTFTGLMWEPKTDDNGLRDADNTYTWFNSSAASNGGAAGTASGGVCTGGIGCDTEKYVAAINAAQLCGFSDWRLPTVAELAGIIDNSKTVAPTIDAGFANQRATDYWTAAPLAADANGAWLVNFNTGAVGGDQKSRALPVRLVRGR